MPTQGLPGLKVVTAKERARGASERGLVRDSAYCGSSWSPATDGSRRLEGVERSESVRRERNVRSEKLNVDARKRGRCYA